LENWYKIPNGFYIGSAEMVIRSKKQLSRAFSWASRYANWTAWILILILLTTTLLFSNQLSNWLKNLAFIQVLDSVGKLGILVALITFFLEIPKRDEQAKLETERRQFEYWKAIDSAKSSSEVSPDGRFTSYALRMALQNLVEEKDSSGKLLKIRNVDFSGADLHEINLAGADLMISQFRYSNLSDANFRNANLDKCTFARARLLGADFTGANLTEAAFRDALYDKHTKFPQGFNPNVMGMYKIESKASLSEANLADAMLWDVDLEKADLQRANLKGVILGGSNLRGVNLRQAYLRQARAANIDLRGACLCDADFSDANLYQVKFNHADIKGTNFQGSRIQGADFRGAINIDLEQIKAAENWEQATYDDDFRVKLGLKAETL
jgi:uncharacterized protein YjbI with pentapeptide repeats